MNTRILIITLLIGIAHLASAQTNVNQLGGQVNIISTAVPFLNISPESRAGGMGNAGVATSPDVYSQHWNPAKYAFMDKSAGASLSYTPWLRQLVNDINLAYLTGYLKLNKTQAVSTSLRYFSLGDITFTDSDGGEVFSGKPNEFAIDAAYSTQLSKVFSGSVALRYIHSNLTLGQSSGSNTTHPGNAFAADVAFYFQKKTKISGNKSDISAGLNISNIGTKISYDDTNKEFLPCNLKLGTAVKTEIDKYNSVSFALDFNKLLVPTPQNATTHTEWVEENRNTSVTSGIFKSFNDAPGGMTEEINEINISIGGEYLYNDQFAIRLGYFHEHETKGNRKYFTAGAGLKFNMLTFDASYIVPVVQNNPLANTIRFSLAFDLSEFAGNRR